MDNVLPAEAVAVLLLDRACDQHGIFVGEKPQILHDSGSVDCGDNAAALVGYAPASDFQVIFIALVGVKGPVVPVADAHGVDVGVKGDEGFTGAHVSQNIAHGADFYLVKFQAAHLLGDAVDVGLLPAALPGISHNLPKKPGHVLLIALGGFFDFSVIQTHFSNPFHTIFL